MRTAISERERELVDYCVNDYMRARELQEFAAEKLAEVLAIEADEAIDTLNTACNAQAALDLFGVEVIPDEQVCECDCLPSDLVWKCQLIEWAFWVLALVAILVGAYLYEF